MKCHLFKTPRPVPGMKFTCHMLLLDLSHHNRPVCRHAAYLVEPLVCSWQCSRLLSSKTRTRVISSRCSQPNAPMKIWIWQLHAAAQKWMGQMQRTAEKFLPCLVYIRLYFILTELSKSAVTKNEANLTKCVFPK